MAGKPVELQFITRRSVKGIEWASRDGATPILALAGKDPKKWEAVGSTLSGEFRFVALNLESPYDLINAIWAVGEPGIVIAQGPKACHIAASAALAGTGAVRALVLIEFGEGAGQDWLGELKVPTLVFRGRQSKVQSHKEAVAMHQLIRGSHLIEPEDCGEDPVENDSAMLAEAIEWYISCLGEDHMDYPVNGDPVDPKA